VISYLKSPTAVGKRPLAATEDAERRVYAASTLNLKKAVETTDECGWTRILSRCETKCVHPQGASAFQVKIRVYRYPSVVYKNLTCPDSR
jgi:hypothetical protein